MDSKQIAEGLARYEQLRKLFRVWQAEAVEVSDGSRRDGTCGVYRHDLGVFSSPRKAEDMIRAWVNKYAEMETEVFCYIVREKEVDDGLRGRWGDVCEFKTLRTYRADGRPFCSCYSDSTGEVPFKGRDRKSIKFRCGDFVSFLDGGTIVPGIVGELPMTSDYWRRHYEGKNPGWECDDDCYLVYTADGDHSHPFTPYVFPLVGELSADVRARLEASRDKWAEADRKEICE